MKEHSREVKEPLDHQLPQERGKFGQGLRDVLEVFYGCNCIVVAIEKTVVWFESKREDANLQT